MLLLRSQQDQQEASAQKLRHLSCLQDLNTYPKLFSTTRQASQTELLANSHPTNGQVLSRNASNPDSINSMLESQPASFPMTLEGLASAARLMSLPWPAQWHQPTRQEKACREGITKCFPEGCSNHLVLSHQFTAYSSQQVHPSSSKQHSDNVDGIHCAIGRKRFRQRYRA